MNDLDMIRFALLGVIAQLPPAERELVDAARAKVRDMASTEAGKIAVVVESIDLLAKEQSK